MNPRTYAFKFSKALMNAILVMFIISSQNANAFELNIDNLKTEKIMSHLNFDDLLFESQSLLPIKATYSGGGYYFKYTHNW